jgi:hypothetical protein
VTVSSILKGIGKAADEITSASDDAFKQTVKQARPSQPAPPLPKVSEVENMSDDEFLQLLKDSKQARQDDVLPDPPVSARRQFDEDFPDPPASNEIEEMSDEDFNLLLSEIKKDVLKKDINKQVAAEDVKIAGIDPDNVTTADAADFLAASIGVPKSDIPFDDLPSGFIKEKAAQVQVGLITPKEAFDTLSNLAIPPTLSPVQKEKAFDFILDNSIFATEGDLKQVDEKVLSENFFKFEEGVIDEQTFVDNILDSLVPSSGFSSDEAFATGMTIEKLSDAEQVIEDFLSLTPAQAKILNDNQKLKLANQIVGDVADDDTSMELALSADKIPHLPPSIFTEAAGEDRIRRDVVKTLEAVRTTDDMETAVARVRNREEAIEGRFESPGKLGVDAHKFVQDLDDLEVAAIEFYTHRGDTAVNKALRQGLVEPGSALDNTINFMNQVLDKIPKYDGVVYRDVGRDRFDAYAVGEEVVEKAFTSTTLNRRGLTFKGLQEGRRYPSATFIIQSKEGRYIRPLTHRNYEGEEEVLYKSGQKFRVVDKDPETLQIFLEEVPSE